MTVKLKSILGISFIILSFLGLFFFSTPIKGLKESYYLIFIHPPFAWAGYILFVIASWFSLNYLRKDDENYAMKSNAAMSVGFVFIVFAAFSGMAWGQLFWGDIGISNKDPRFTSIIFVLIIYSAYFILRNSMQDNDGYLKLLSIYTLICMPFATFFIFIMPRIKRSLHPKNPIFSQTKAEESSFGIENFLVLAIALIGVLFIANVLYTLRYKIEEKEAELERLDD